MRLVDYVKAHLVVVPIDDAGKLIARGAVTIDGRVGRIADPVCGDNVVAVATTALESAVPPQDVALAIDYEDDDLLICDKPAGVHVHPMGAHRAGTLLNALLWHCGARSEQPWGRWRPRPMHRLDRAASGLIAIAKHASIHDSVRRQLADSTIERRYRATVEGRIVDDRGTIDAPLGRDPAFDYRRAVVADGQRAVTHWRVIERGDTQSVVEVVIATGRTHQIRVHLASIGHPIVGDTLYAGAQRGAIAIALHACELRLRHPRTGVEIICRSRATSASAPLPP